MLTRTVTPTTVTDQMPQTQAEKQVAGFRRFLADLYPDTLALSRYRDALALDAEEERLCVWCGDLNCASPSCAMQTAHTRAIA